MKMYRFRLVTLLTITSVGIVGLLAAYQNSLPRLTADDLPVTSTPFMNFPATQQIIQIPTSDYLSSAGPSIGQTAPDFSLPALDGTIVKLSNFPGQVILINFWTSWCAPCRLEAPELENAYRTYKDKGFTILGVNQIDQDNLAEVQAYLKEFGLTYPILLDHEGHVSNDAYHLLGVPMSVLVNRHGVVTAVQMGGLTHDQLDQMVQSALNS